MFEAVKARWESQDIIIKAAAVADYTPLRTEEDKIKKRGADMTLSLGRTQDILAWLGEHKKENQVLCGFSNGNPGCAGKFQGKAGTEKRGYDCRRTA